MGESFNMAKEIVTVETQDNIAVVTLDDGKVNVFSPAMADRLQACFDRIDPDIGAVVVTGRPGIFSGGFDLKTIGTGDPDALANMVTKTIRMAMDVMQFPRPVIGAATGHCVAMGALFMMTMDYRVGARGDYRIGLNEIRDGLTLPIFAVELARYRLPTASLIPSALHATLRDPVGAVQAGFLDEVVEPDALMDTALKHARRLAQLPNPAYRVSKENLVRPVREHILETLEADIRGG